MSFTYTGITYACFNLFDISIFKSFKILVALQGLIKENAVVYVSVLSVEETHTFNWEKHSNFLTFKFFFFQCLFLI